MSTMTLRPFAAFVTLALAAVVSPLARGQTSPFMGMDAAVQAAGYPSWMEEGVRMTFRVHSSTPNTAGTGLITAAGGLTQVDLVSVAGGNAAGNMNAWMEVPASPFGGRGGWAMHSQTGFVMNAGYGEYWVHPTVLAKAAEAHAASTTWQVTRGSQRVAGKTYQAIGFVATTDKSRQSYLYDSKDGLLLALGTAQRNGPTATFQPTLTIELVGVRTRVLPWRHGRPSAWALDAKRFVYEGAMVTSFSNGFESRVAVEICYDVTSAGPNYLVGTLSSKYDGVASDAPPQRVSGASGSGGVWIPPLELQALAARYKGRNISLDKDSATSSELSLTFAGRSQYGRNIVTVSERTGVSQAHWDYELETGVLLHMSMRYDPGSFTVETWLTELE